MQIADVKISPNLFDINMNATNCMCSINENLLHTFLPTNLNQFAHRNDDAGHGSNVIYNCKSDFPAMRLTLGQAFAKLSNDFQLGTDGEGQLDNDDRPTGASNVSLNGLLDGLKGAMEHDDGVTFLKGALGECPADVLKDDGGGSSGVVDDGDLVDMVGVDERLDEGPGTEDAFLEVVEEEIVGLLEESELPALLGGNNGGRAAAEAAVVNSRNIQLVVGELLPDFSVGYEGGGGQSRKLLFLGEVVVIVTVIVVAVGSWVFHVHAALIYLFIYLFFLKNKTKKFDLEIGSL